MLGHGVRCIFLTAPLSYAAVAFSFGEYEKRLRHGKLATSYMTAVGLPAVRTVFDQQSHGIIKPALSY
jgi:hypothetical protein